MSDIEQVLTVPEDQQQQKKAKKVSIKAIVLWISVISFLGLMSALLYFGFQENTPQQLKIQNNVEQLNEEQVKNQMVSQPQDYLPTTFDQRNFPIQCDFSIVDEELCVGGNWANTIASTIKISQCFQQQPAKDYSAQQLLNCAGKDARCDILQSVQDFESVLQYISNTGIAEQQCIQYQGFNYNNINCNTTCDDGKTQVSLTKFNSTNLTVKNDPQQTIQKVKSNIFYKGPVIMLIRHTASVTSYIQDVYKKNYMDQSYFGLRALKIIGWDITDGDQPTNYWIAANTFSSNWGSQGYIYIDMNQTDDLIQGYYSIQI